MFSAQANTCYINEDGQHSFDVDYSDSDGTRIACSQIGKSFEEVLLKTLQDIEDQTQTQKEEAVQKQQDAIDAEIASLNEQLAKLREEKAKIETPKSSVKGDFENVLDKFLSEKLIDNNILNELIDIVFGV